MGLEVEQSSLMRYLQKKNIAYYGKILEVRRNLVAWLSLVPSTFPHYTRHTVEHSDEIVMQLSKLLFLDDDYTKPVVKLSSIEVYILISSAYLHDAGMVVSDKEKAEILASEDWQRFVSDGNPGAKRWKAIDDLRRGSAPRDVHLRHYLADVQTRFLIAEFVRKSHHQRTVNILAQHELGLGAFSFGDPILRDTISNVCLAHGLNRYELLDIERFPERRDIRNETANTRFLAILLRIGDLLDMNVDRACPLLLNVACSIPADNLAHWTKYQRIDHRLTAPDRIELHASCHNQDEHRFLTDWCKWLEEEVKEAGNIMARASRHGGWRPPEVSMGGETRTIKIEPAESARYVPSTWKFVLDEDVVFERLVRDVYVHPLTFVRELVQNALDANRCQLYSELREKGLSQPDFPTEVDEDARNRFPVLVSLSTKMLDNQLSGVKEEYQVLTVEDCGIGMDRAIIANYLLQIGRSYYTTEEFRRTFKFVPSSRFGIGFLSVFAVSDNVMIETYKPSSQANDGPLRITLTGPRNYLLTEKGTRRTTGTKIEVLLRKPLNPHVLTDTLSFWCKRVEFPVIVNDLGEEKILRAEKSQDIEFETPVISLKDAKIRLKAYPIESYGVQGEIYILSMVEGGLDRLDRSKWIKDEYPVIHPSAKEIVIPDGIICVNGLTLSSSWSGFGEPFSYRVDIRKEMPFLTVARSFPMTRMLADELAEFVPEINQNVEKILRIHLKESKLARSRDGWIYKNRVARDFDELPFWISVPGTLKAYRKGKPTLVSIERLCNEQTVTLVTDQRSANRFRSVEPLANEKSPIPSSNNLVVLRDDLYKVYYRFVEHIFAKRRCTSMKWSSTKSLVLDWGQSSKEDFAKYGELALDLVDFENKDLIGISLASRPERVLFNLGNPLTKWLLLLRGACERGTNGLKTDLFKRTLLIMRKAIKYAILKEEQEHANDCINGWRETPNLPSELKPPSIAFREEYVLSID